jgi:acetyl esterase/lipase
MTATGDSPITVGPPPPYDRELAELAGMIGPMSHGFRDDLAGARAMFTDYTSTDEQLSRGGTFNIERRAVPGPEGQPDITLLIARPTAVTGPMPVIYMIHGGGMIMGDITTGLDYTLGYAEELSAAAVSVEYRLAPESPHPAPVEDCYAGLVWTVEHAEELGFDADRVIVSGGSAGGGLCAATVLLARDRGGPAVFGQLMNCPMLDDRNETGSSRQLAGLGVWDHDDNEFGWNALLGDARGMDGVSQYAAPARAEDLSGLPPTFIDVGSAETFRDEAVDYASRIWAAGGSAELHVWPGAFHGFTGMAPGSAIALDAREAPLRWLQRLST